jgi:hypothetical protein
METTSKLWDLNCEVESPEKAGFLLLSGYNNPLWKEKRRRRGGHETGQDF